MQKNLYVPDSKADVWKKAEEYCGESISARVTSMLEEFVEGEDRKREAVENMEFVVVSIDPESLDGEDLDATIRFRGCLIGSDEDTTVYRLESGKFLLHDDENKAFTYEDLDALNAMLEGDWCWLKGRGAVEEAVRAAGGEPIRWIE